MIIYGTTCLFRGGYFHLSHKFCTLTLVLYDDNRAKLNHIVLLSDCLSCMFE